MTRRDSGTTSTDRHRMVERQLRRRGIHDERVLAAMEEVPREHFLPEDARRRAYRDGAVRIGDGSLGAPERGPFGGISVTATARDRPPPALFEQLAEGAALVCPVD